MSKRHWEDFKPGAVAVYGPRLVTREEIVAFAAEFDPQPMHLDEAAGAATLLGGLAASGWHSCCILMRFVKCLFELLDERDTVLITLTSPLMIRRREAGARP